MQSSSLLYTFCRCYKSPSLWLLLKKLNKHILTGTWNLNGWQNEWIHASQLSLNVSETEITIFKPKNKNITKCLNFRMSGQKIKSNKQVKYLGVILQDDIYWNSHLSSLKTKLSCAIGLLSKVSHYVSKYLLRVIYITLCLTHIWYMIRVYSNCFMHAIVACMRLPFFKIFSNCVHFCPNLQKFSSFSGLIRNGEWSRTCLSMHLKSF